MGFGISFGIGPFRFGASTGGGGGGGDFTEGELDFVSLLISLFCISIVIACFRWLINETVGGFNFVAYIICPAVIWPGAAFISCAMHIFLGDFLGRFSMMRKISFSDLVIPLAISLLSPWTFVIAMRDIPLIDRRLWNLSGPELQKRYGSKFAELAPFKTWLMVIIGGYLLVLLVVCLLSFLTPVYLRLREREHDESLMELHREIVKEHGFTSVSELTSYLAKARNEEFRQMLERTNREAKEARKSENLKNYLDKVREAQSKSSRKISKEMYDSILDDLNDKVKMKLNPGAGEAITHEEMLEAFQHARRRVNAATKLIDEHQKIAWEQIGKLAWILLNEADWDVSAPTPMGG